MTDTFTPGQRVRFTADTLGVMRLDAGAKFAAPTVGKGDTGTVFSHPGQMPDGWLMVETELTDDDGARLYAPVHPDMIEAA